MSDNHLIRRSAEHNAWANETLVGWLSAKSDDVLNRETASSRPTILTTLKHIWEAQEYWTGIVGETDDITRVWELAEPSRDEIMNGLAANSRRLAEIVGTMSDDELARPFPVKNQWLDVSLPKAEYLHQVIGHGAYHRGQIVTIARGFGVTDAPMTDFIVWAMK